MQGCKLTLLSVCLLPGFVFASLNAIQNGVPQTLYQQPQTQVKPDSTRAFTGANTYSRGNFSNLADIKISESVPPQPAASVSAPSYGAVNIKKIQAEDKAADAKRAKALLPPPKPKPIVIPLPKPVLQSTAQSIAHIEAVEQLGAIFSKLQSFMGDQRAEQRYIEGLRSVAKGNYLLNHIDQARYQQQLRIIHTAIAMQTYGRTTLQFAKDYKKLPAAQRVSALSSYEDFLTEEHSHNRLSSPDYKKTINGLNALNKIITDPDINLDLC